MKAKNKNLPYAEWLKRCRLMEWNNEQARIFQPIIQYFKSRNCELSPRIFYFFGEAFAEYVNCYANYPKSAVDFLDYIKANYFI